MSNVEKRRSAVKKIHAYFSAQGEKTSAGAICSFLGQKGIPVTEYTVRGDLKALGLTSLSTKGKRPYTAAEDEEIITTVLVGASQSDLAVALERTEHSVHYRVRHLRQEGKLPESPRVARGKIEAAALELFNLEDEDEIEPPIEDEVEPPIEDEIEPPIEDEIEPPIEDEVEIEPPTTEEESSIVEEESAIDTASQDEKSESVSVTEEVSAVEEVVNEVEALDDIIIEA